NGAVQNTLIASLAVFPSVARGKVSVPQAVTLGHTRAYHAALLWDPSIAYHAALLRDPSIIYLVLRSRDVPPAVSPAMSSGGCR
ncbi:unnamed protein product, partial [Staurois parvus]